MKKIVLLAFAFIVAFADVFAQSEYREVSGISDLPRLQTTDNRQRTTETDHRQSTMLPVSASRRCRKASTS